VVLGILGGLFFVAATGGIVFAGLRPAAAIWRGDASRVPHLGGISVNARSYLAFLLWFVPCFLGPCLVAIVAVVATLIGSTNVVLSIVAVAGFALMAVGVPWLGLHWFVSAFARPKFLIPPPYRGQRGSIAERQERRRRRRAGLPPTEHLVEIHDVRPFDPAEYEPYLVAICAEPDCGWLEFADPKLIGPSEEGQLREKAAKHSTRVAADLQRPLA
jgi:hypothetical protein